MKRLSFFMAVVTALIVCSCGKSEFLVHFELSPDVIENYRLVYYTSDKEKGWISENVAVVTQGKGEVKGITRLPTIVYVYYSGSRPSVAFYAERGDKITIKGKDADPAKWEIDGNDINEEWSAWRQKHASQLADPSGHGANKAVEEYVKQNSDNPLSLILLMTSYDRRLDEAGFMKLWNTLGEEAKRGKWLQLFNRSDLPGLTPASSGNAAKLTFLANPDSVVRFSARDSRKTLFWFRRNNDYNERQTTLDSLRSFFREKEKNVARIALVSFDTDSASARRSFDMDSIPGSLKLWSPEGEVAESSLALGVRETPWFAVINSSGKVIYGGVDIVEALKAMRRKN